jgi:hypothetical protein
MIYLIHCKNLCKCLIVPPPSTITKKKTERFFQFIQTIKKKNLANLWEGKNLMIPNH